MNLKKEISTVPQDGVEEVKGETLCDMENGAQNPADLVKLPNGSTTRFWLCGDMKELDFIAGGGGHDQGFGIPFNRWMLFMFVARVTSNIIFEDATSSEVDDRRVINGETYAVAKFLPHNILAKFFEENYEAFLELVKSKKCPSRTKPNDHFRNLVAEVREDAYKKYNNCTSFPKEGFDKLKEKYGVKFVDHEDDFFNFPADPLTDFALQCSIVGPNGNGTLDNFYLDPIAMQNILNIVNLQILDSIN